MYWDELLFGDPSRHMFGNQDEVPSCEGSEFRYILAIVAHYVVHQRPNSDQADKLTCELHVVVLIWIPFGGFGQCKLQLGEDSTRAAEFPIGSYLPSTSDQWRLDFAL